MLIIRLHIAKKFGPFYNDIMQVIYHQHEYLGAFLQKKHVLVESAFFENISNHRLQ